MFNKRIAVIAVLTLMFSCTKLNEKILDETSVTGQTQKQIADGLIAPVYARLPDIYRHTTYFALQEISTDEAILPYRGGTDWGDNGIYISLHKHETTSTDPNVRDTWNLITQSLSRSVVAINALADNKDANAKTYIAEARAMRGFYNWLALDMFNLSFVKEKPDDISQLIRGKEAMDYIISDLLAAEPDLTTTAGPGRITKNAVYGLLARIYLNASVYRDRYAATHTFSADDMDKVIDYTNRIISSGTYALSSDYFSIFNDDNHNNKELVFAVDQRAELNGHNRLAYFSLSGDQFPLTAYPAANGTDGPAITPDFYNTWEAAAGSVDPSLADPRFSQTNLAVQADDTCVKAADFKMNRGILRGQQWGLIRVSGAFVKCANGDFKVAKLYNVTRNKPTLPVNFTKAIDYTAEGSNYSTGYRVLKFQFSAKSTSGRNFGDADIPIVRIADVYLMRAEAKLRKGDNAGALADVNTVRTARVNGTVKAAPLSAITLETLLRERGFELYWEMHRRTDLIRFDKYEGTWTEKTNTNKNMRVFPIPQTAIDGASNIPNYLTQNPGY
jgi:starch-binding outer membrane protein, SusD/RagB family